MLSISKKVSSALTCAPTSRTQAQGEAVSKWVKIVRTEPTSPNAFVFSMRCETAESDSTSRNECLPHIVTPDSVTGQEEDGRERVLSLVPRGRVAEQELGLVLKDLAQILLGGLGDQVRIEIILRTTNRNRVRDLD